MYNKVTRPPECTIKGEKKNPIITILAYAWKCMDIIKNKCFMEKDMLIEQQLTNSSLSVNQKTAHTYPSEIHIQEAKFT